MILAKAGHPVARLVPIEQPAKRLVGFVDGTVGNDFFEPLEPDELAAWE